MAGMGDGGIWALAGYLYQVVGTLAITARAISELHISAPDEGANADVALEFLEVGRAVCAYPERFDQDALFASTDETIIAQFKYSSSPDNKIDKAELGDIIRKLDSAAKQASRGRSQVTACAIITNRQFTTQGDSAEAFWQAQQQKERSYALRRKLNFSIESAVRQLQALGREFGAFDDEIQSGIWKLVGKVFTETGGQEFVRGVFAEDLCKAFTDHRGARKLTASAIATLSQESLRSFGEGLRVEQWHDEPIQRDILDELVQRVRDRALVCLCGSGGTGKSTLLWQIARRMDCGRAIGLARNVPHSWVEDTINGWRNTPSLSRSMNDHDEALRRLETANPTTPRPILWLALDGLDEGIELTDQRSAIRKLLTWFWEIDKARHMYTALPATLVITLRHPRDVSRWLDLMSDHPGELPTIMEISDFSQTELQSALNGAFTESGYRATSEPATPFALIDSESATLPQGISSSVRPDTTINEMVLDALRHPAMWRALLSLESQAIQRRALIGDRDAVMRLVRKYIQWFHDKLLLRRKAASLTLDQLLEILQAIARHPPTGTRLNREHDWVIPACSMTELIDRREANSLFDEAFSAGLIVLDTPMVWHWQHRLVLSCLTQESEVADG